LYGVDVDRFGPEALQLLLERQILVQQPMLDELDGCRVQWIGTSPFLFDLDADRPPEEVDPRLLSVYEINVLALCRALRRANQLAGPPVAQLSDLAYFIGHRGDGRQRRSVCLARLLRDDTVLDVVWNLRARIGTGTLVLLTPGVVELRRRTLEHLSADRALVAPLLDGLDPDAPDPFALRTAALAGVASAARSDARMQIDTAGWRATLDRREIPLGRQEFAILSALAEEAIDKNGYVGRADLLGILEAYRDNPKEDPATPENLGNTLSRLRRALADAAGIPISEMTPLVETKRGLGHRLGLRKLGLEPGDIATF
jgi:hypothetical protein